MSGKKNDLDAIEKLVEHVRTYCDSDCNWSNSLIQKLKKIIQIQHEALKEGSKCWCECPHSYSDHDCVNKANRIAKEILK